jgi:hypothetical protein
MSVSGGPVKSITARYIADVSGNLPKKERYK